jgi:hypothetical protein
LRIIITGLQSNSDLKDTQTSIFVQIFGYVQQTGLAQIELGRSTHGLDSREHLPLRFPNIGLPAFDIITTWSGTTASTCRRLPRAASHHSSRTFLTILLISTFAWP